MLLCKISSCSSNKICMNINILGLPIWTKQVNLARYLQICT
uniref:Uncharacterized protein n=1 Tax=Rhizophora mucronata TaxID=61149 RepID=A0A2P2IJW6_RHIMU